ncbi:putative archaeal flagellar protein G [Candidatus Methanoperedens nitroreducens]|uniref:Putative archaeal flagellar protein G n=1 Tax=Candidatus Methanoperedens nitratireducens TaxID=1392998 RepID=A0A062V5P9_9EURY|nr:hypothetical protein [Candidatus Methanoperedens nitroreducens]KCZ71134.1 putative archaeal flagellar protein G [Candidatus Methanoperedens nitroreducens]MDJ1421488.1 flagellar protein G [Candidatus Methanoperedens sp.]
MGADTSATHIIFFITSVVIALSVTGAIFLNIQSLTSAANAGSKTLSEQLKTDITIINDPENIPYSGNYYTFYVKNTGKEDLLTDYITILINGVVVSDANLDKTIIGGGVMWRTGDVLMINATVTLASGSHNIRVITGNGIEDSFNFRK